MTNKIVLCCLVALSAFCLTTQASPVIVPLAPTKSSSFFWYPTEDGGYVPAFLEGGPPAAKGADADSDIKFYLFTLNNQNTAYELFINDDTNLANSGYIPNAPLKILSHGFSSSSSGGPGNSFKAEYFKKNLNYNVVLLDWGPLAAAPWYDTAAGNTKVVGERTALFVQYLISKGLTSLDLVHFAGHSLGAHVGGFLGSAVGAGKLGRITALDPALPLFGAADDSGRIDPSDAAFVDVIHTAGGSLLEGGLAFREERGHIDFYPNSGEHQPGCGADAFGTCSHSRCYAYMAESIANPNGFFACKCESWDDFNLGRCPCTETAHMGELVDSSKRGRFYLHTNGASPFSQSK